jgi:hypothetical protein
MLCLRCPRNGGGLARLSRPSSRRSSVSLEAAQTFLPARVASNLDVRGTPRALMGGIVGTVVAPWVLGKAASGVCARAGHHRRQ